MGHLTTGRQFEMTQVVLMVPVARDAGQVGRAELTRACTIILPP